ncbi:UvrD-like helicase ATP-binding domain-containing protein [Citrus sinensis]|uniref:UvrD-like helicase ATP-binding domain-containing protein n=1 Tax=Citrus sinensis TaxID=2711 RepID=A0ACB8INV0_CITSI|nr:UvrD-like helicase ATP-binding domain-containing protein [Citrus sinensis]
MMEGEANNSRRKKKRAVPYDYGFTDTVFSWSQEDIFNENLFKDKVKRIPFSFRSVGQYFESFVFPLLEETRANLMSGMEKISNAPFAQVVAFEDSKPYGSMLYDVKVDCWRNRFSNLGREPYKTLPGDILVLADAKPETASDLQRVGRMWTFVSVANVTEDENEIDTSSTYFKVNATKEIQIDVSQKSLFVIFLTNRTSNRRIWNSLHMKGNLKIIKELLCTDSGVDETCELCSMQSEGVWNETFGPSLSSTLNDSQAQAVLSCLRQMRCDHKATIQLIWGPPGTGKTKTVSMLLVILLQMKFRTLVCTPTNVAIKELAARVVKLVKESVERDCRDALFFPLGDILLLGNNERLKVDSGVEEIYLDYRVKRLADCFAPLTGWSHCFASMVDFLDNCVSLYHTYIDNESMKQSEDINGDIIKEKECGKEADVSDVEIKPFLEFVRDRFKCIAAPLRSCIFNFCTRIPKCYIGKDNFHVMATLISLLDSFETLLFEDNLVSEELEELLSHSVDEGLSKSIVGIKYLLHKRRSECHFVLRKLQSSFNELNLPSAVEKDLLEDLLKSFCLKRASLFLSTASSSYMLHSVAMEPLNFLVIDEAAQLKESESTIPLQLSGIKHAVLFGDECQLPAMVESKVSNEACFGRSLFERLSYLGYSKHLLSIQYRMHPSISCFPNSYFYENKIRDSSTVRKRSYEKRFLHGPMYGPYSFINVFGGREEFIEHSCRNMVEVSVVMKILLNLYKAWIDSKEKLSIGIVSPYSAQVVAIQEKLGSKYVNSAGFAVKVMSIDGFQGGEEDLIIISTVRSNNGGSIGFLSNSKRVNVALTRARHCLWILGNARTLTRKKSVWEALVHDANARQCFFNADDDKDLGKAILAVKKELDELDELLNPESRLFRSQRWKVNFSENFLKSFRKLTSDPTKKSVIHLLLKLSNGWRPKKRNVDSVCGSSLHIIKQFKVEGFYIICTIDIVKESQYFQVLKVWDILPLEDVPKVVARLDNIYVKYTDEFINHCKEKSIEGNLEVPKTWTATSNVVRFKNLADNDNNSGSDLSGAAFDSRNYAENSNVSESLSLMKFYRLSSDVVSHLLSDRVGRELDLPFEVTDEQLEMILSPRSTFILGRSGTGKTTVLTRKLFQKEELHRMAMEGFYGVNNSVTLHCSRESEAEEGLGETERPILRQLFVTVSPKLCFAIKQHISQMKSSAFGGKFVAESSLIDIDDEAEFKDIPNSFAHIPAESYPLVITFHKFLMMLDGTLGSSYFDRFHDIRKHYGQVRNSSLLFLQTFIRTKEVNFERFCSSYWPRFNTQLTKKLDPSRVFTEIISHIRGGLQSIDVADGKLCREDYIRLSETRVSTLLRSEREKIYEIYENYEQMKMRNGEFDLADLVNDLHRRFKEERYKGDEFHFVYIDEVQDLTMSQIALFKYVCRNIEEGFVFSGDTAQTIARGIDFRFQDIRSLFYKKFVLESRNTRNVGRQEKGQLSNIFNLSQNFRTHAGVLNLAQSVIELLYRFFPHSVDILKPETSLIYGEPPVLLESRDDENAVIKIFGNSGDAGGNMVGFGAEQVILVRDDCVRKEISNYVRKQALVLTILESKGLEFQDVLLYDFFGSSPIKNLWRVVYEYMKEQALFDSTLPGSFPSFNEAKHNLLCSELKQLYVAITRTRQRLWIWENMEEFSKPMFDYWKKRLLVQVRQLDDSLAQEMQVASSLEEWKLRGIKTIHEQTIYEQTIYEQITREQTIHEQITHEQTIHEQTTHEQTIHEQSTHEQTIHEQITCEPVNTTNSQELFYEQNYEMATICFEKAKDTYWEGRSKASGLKAAADRISHSNLLEANVFLREAAKIFEAIGKADSAAKCFCDLGEYERAVLEEEFGKFMDAANIARLRGDILRTADLLQKAGNHKEACNLTLNYVLSNSLWSAGSKGWPLKQFTQKKELLEKAKLLAKSESNKFYKFVCTEAYILSNDQSDLLIMNQQLNASKRHQSVNGETLSARKILDFHLHTNSSEYVWEDELVLDETNCNKRVSVQTLIYFWNCWKDKIVNVLKYLECLKSQDFNDYRSYGDFCLNYLSVWRQYNNGNIIYLLLNSDAEWVKDLDNRHALRSGKLASINVHQLVSAGRNYWSSELLSIGMKVLDNLEALYKQSSKNSPSVWCHVLCPAYMYEVAKFLLSSNYPSLQYHAKVQQKFVDQSMEHFVDSIFPLEWNIIREVVYKHIGLKGNLSYGQIGNAVVMILRNGKLGNDAYGRVAKRFDGNTPWKEFVESLSFDMGLESCRGSALHNHDDMKEVSHVWKFYRALCDTYEVNWRRADYITPDCFLYLIERLLILLSSFRGCIFTTKSSFVDWLIYQEWSTNPTCSLFTDLHQLFGVVHEFIFNIVQQFLYNEKETMEWIKKSCTEIKDYHSLVILRLVMIVCLLHLNFGNSLNLLVDLLGRNNIFVKLPWEFYDALRRRRKHDIQIVIAEAFEKIGNPLVVANLGEICPEIACPDAIVLDMKVTRRKKDILGILRMWRKVFNLLSAAMNGCFQKNSFHGEDQSRWNEATSMLEDLKQLDGALNGVMSSNEEKMIATLATYASEAQGSSRKPENKRAGMSKSKKNKNGKGDVET